MIATSKVTSKHQTTLPKAVVEALNLQAGSRLVYEMGKEGIHLYARTGTLGDLLEDDPLVPPPASPVTVEEMNACVAESAAGYGAKRK